MESINNQNINNKNPLCIVFSDADACIIEEVQNKYLIFTLTKKSKKVLEICRKLWNKKMNEKNENKYYPQIHIHECEYECEYEL